MDRRLGRAFFACNSYITYKVMGLVALRSQQNGCVFDMWFVSKTESSVSVFGESCVYQNSYLHCQAGVESYSCILVFFACIFHRNYEYFHLDLLCWSLRREVKFRCQKS